MGLLCGLCFRTVLYSKTSTISCSASFQLHSDLDWCWQSWVYHSWNIGLWLVCHCVVWMQHISIPFLLSPCVLCSSFPSSDQSAAVGSPRGWEIPTATSHCTALQSTIIHGIFKCLHSENQDHLVTRPAKSKTLTLFLNPCSIQGRLKFVVCKQRKKGRWLGCVFVCVCSLKCLWGAKPYQTPTTGGLRERCGKGWVRTGSMHATVLKKTGGVHPSFSPRN